MNEDVERLKCPHCTKHVADQDGLFCHVKAKHGPKLASLVRPPKLVEDDDDMGAYYRDLRELEQERRHGNLADFLASDLFACRPFVRHDTYHYATRAGTRMVNYWPSTGKWQPQDAHVQSGSLAAFAEWLKLEDKAIRRRERREPEDQGAQGSEFGEFLIE